MFSRDLFPDASLGEDSKEFTSCEFTLFSSSLFTDSPFRELFVVPSRPQSNRSAHTNSKRLRKYGADLQNE